MTSRQKRLSGSEATCDYSPSNDDWSRIENAYCNKLDSGTRDEIIALVKEYLPWEGAERNAPFANDAIKWLNSKCVEAFYRWLCESNQAAASEAAIRIELRLKQLRLEVVSFENLIGFMANFVEVTRAIAMEIEGLPPGFVEGPAWDNLIIGLTNVAKARRLPFRASKGSFKAFVEEPSDFVRLVRALQDTFPEPSRRHQITYAATAEAICVARRSKKRKTNDAAGQSRSSAF